MKGCKDISLYKTIIPFEFKIKDQESLMYELKIKIEVSNLNQALGLECELEGTRFWLYWLIIPKSIIKAYLFQYFSRYNEYQHNI